MLSQSLSSLSQRESKREKKEKAKKMKKADKIPEDKLDPATRKAQQEVKVRPKTTQS